MNDKGRCIFSQEFIFRSGKPQYCETLNLGPHTLGKCSTTELYPAPLKYILTPNFGPFRSRSWASLVTEEKGLCKAGAIEPTGGKTQQQYGC